MRRFTGSPVCGTTFFTTISCGEHPTSHTTLWCHQIAPQFAQVRLPLRGLDLTGDVLPPPRHAFASIPIAVASTMRSKLSAAVKLSVRTTSADEAANRHSTTSS
jgi:hypothetical protein